MSCGRLTADTNQTGIVFSAVVHIDEASMNERKSTKEATASLLSERAFDFRPDSCKQGFLTLG